jgi:hypothetical protein
MRPLAPLRLALEDPNLLGAVMAGDSWLAWRSILLAAMGESLTAGELATFTRLTGRTTPPPGRVEELWGVIGRRGGKSSAIAALAIYLAGLCDYKDSLSPGEKGVVLCIAPDQRQARIMLDYCTGILESTPILAQLIASRTADTLELTTGIRIEVRSASFRRLRGVTCVATIADEACFWLSDESANPDTEILNAVRPSLATTGGPLIVISSPYARRGEVWTTYAKHFGAQGHPLILVAQGPSRELNPSLPQSVINRAYERDAASAAAEYGAQFRTDLEALLTIEAVQACIERGCKERPPLSQLQYVGFCDPSGGSADSYTLSIAHKQGGSAFLDLVREVKPPFSPEGVTEEFAQTLLKYRVTKVYGDRYAGEWPREQFRKHGIGYATSDSTKSELYLALVPLINSEQINLLDNDRLTNQFVGLERRTSRGGKDSIDHMPGAHDDLANAVAGALTLAFKKADHALWNSNKPLQKYAINGVRGRHDGWDRYGRY